MAYRLSRVFLMCAFLPMLASGMGRRPSRQEDARRTPLIVVVDAGHGGKNEGAVVHGRSEREIVLEITLKLQTILENRPGMMPFLTRWSDEFVALTDRVKRADEVDGDVFLSLHVDNNRVRKGRGVMVYVYGKNRTIPSGPEREPDEEILPPPPKAQIEKSRRLAQHVRQSMKKHGIKTAGYVDRGPFAVLKSGSIPSVLVELGNLRDREEAEQVSDPAYQDRLAEALADSVEGFLRERYGSEFEHSVSTR